MYKINYFNKKIGINNFYQIGGESKIKAENNGITVGRSNLENSGSGVFATKDFNKDDVLEVVPVLKIPIESVSNNILKDYVFMYDDNNYGVALGYGSIYNHQDDPNVIYSYSDDKEFMIYKTLKDIKSGDELFVSYGIGWWNHRNLKPIKLP